jgi:hypothetical protein
MRKTKNLVLSKIKLSIADNLFGCLSTFNDLTPNWDVLCHKFLFNNQSCLFMLTYQLHIFKM